MPDRAPPGAQRGFDDERWRPSFSFERAPGVARSGMDGGAFPPERRGRRRFGEPFRMFTCLRKNKTGTISAGF